MRLEAPNPTLRSGRSPWPACLTRRCPWATSARPLLAHYRVTSPSLAAIENHDREHHREDDREDDRFSRSSRSSPPRPPARGRTLLCVLRRRRLARLHPPCIRGHAEECQLNARDLGRGLIHGLADQIRRELAKTACAAASGYQDRCSRYDVTAEAVMRRSCSGGPRFDILS